MEVQEKLPLKEVQANIIDKNNGLKDYKNITKEEQVRFNKYVVKAKEALDQEKDVGQSLEYYKKALKICHHEKLERKIMKMQAYLEKQKEEKDNEDGEEDDSDAMVHVADGFYLFKELYDKLYAHQKEGILWMWRIHKKRKGGILGDDMGLGKTIQVIAFLSGMFDADLVKHVLIILPVALMVNWQREFEKWAPGIRLVQFHGNSKKERERNLAKVQRRGGVCMTTYGMIVNHASQLAERDGREFVWSYVIMDEGHKIKNPGTKCAKGAHSIPSKNRIMLTGTPIQNNLKELWALFDWTHQGTLLGTARTFGMEYEHPISRARQKDATVGEQRLGEEMAKSLKKIISPYFLRRTKAEVNKKEKNPLNPSDENGVVSKSKKMPTLSRKNDLIVWVYLSDLQQKIYEDFVHTEEVRELLNTSKSPLTALTVLKKICDHPRLMTTSQCLQMGLDMDKDVSQAEVLDEATSSQCAANRIHHIDDELLIQESGKMVFLTGLLDNLKSEGHRCLIFSQSRKILDILQKVLRTRGHKVMRLDGTISKLYEREEIINKFSRDKSYSVFLLTTQVGGVGLTLTAADRVIIYDPSWNPATDAQAVDRAFRIGQDKNVVIYRLITCGSVEEKIYRRQIFKDSITKQTTGESKNPYRYFSKQELHELFVLDNPRYSNTQEQLQSLHSNQRKSDTSLDEHIAFLHTLEMFGITDHDLMFSKDAHVEHETEEDVQEEDYIQKRVSKAQNLLTLESDQNIQMTQQHGRYLPPEVFQTKTREPAKSNPTKNTDGESQLKIPPKPVETNYVDLTTPVQSDSEEELEKTMNSLKLEDEEDQSPRSPTPPPRRKNDENPSSCHINIVEDTPEKSERGDASIYQTPEKNPGAGDVIPDSPMQIEESPHKLRTPALLGHNTPMQIDPASAKKVSQWLETVNPNISVTPPTVLLGNEENLPMDMEPNKLATPNKSAKKKRRSVCIPKTPRKLLDDEFEPVVSPQVVKEELLFSPKPEEAVIQPINPSDTIMSMDYEAFAKQIKMNSTCISASDRSSQPANSQENKLKMEPMIEEEMEQGTPIKMPYNNQISDTESPMIQTAKLARKSKRAVIESDEEESDDGSPEQHPEDYKDPNDSYVPVENDTDEEDQKEQGEEEAEEGDEEIEESEEEEEESSSEEEEELSEEQQLKYIDLMTKSKSAKKEGNFTLALQLALDALEIYDGDERACNYARKLQERLIGQ